MRILILLLVASFAATAIAVAQAPVRLCLPVGPVVDGPRAGKAVPVGAVCGLTRPTGLRDAGPDPMSGRVLPPINPFNAIGIRSSRPATARAGDRIGSSGTLEGAAGAGASAAVSVCLSP